MKGSLYTLVYAAALGTACALVLTFAASFTRPYREANAAAKKARNILVALGVDGAEKMKSKEVIETLEQSVTEKELGGLAAYVYSDQDGKVLGTAIRFSGPGLWGPVKGFLALEPDMKTIKGITFYEQEETPGLGGEIASNRWRSQFPGKSIVGADGEIGLVIGPGDDAPNRVDGISGATMTCDKVQAMLNDAVKGIAKGATNDG
ncbi:MAG: FMN-binding protein [Sedimentisphaerales bacterium]|nr:FMN-binding protein [Sedimentisphaerales bacterium]